MKTAVMENVAMCAFDLLDRADPTGELDWTEEENCITVSNTVGVHKITVTIIIEELP